MRAAVQATRRSAVALAIASAALIAALLASPAAAFHIPGAGYSGAVNGGGTINFSVSRDGSSVRDLTLTGIHAGDCRLDSAQYPPMPIRRNSFDNGSVSGAFPNVQGAYGRLNILASGLFGSCRITGTWSATTRADPAGSAECKAAKRRVKKAKRALRRAKVAGNQAKIKKLRKTWEKARNKRDQFC